ncbi:YheC/YheD family protein [Alteribacter natronophilus]|uniref:YheC/YheD family protein n=1 Tax=Alteribacter natronophilus TaxID=2583810 RepID=UPI00110E8369|nr:YheC/YheD family protein [Alteribacter natronophilus]TMW74031.1 hypothetical protein FGB90_07130 [Alteribacter natronophilus]
MNAFTGPVIAVLTGDHPEKGFSGDERLYRALAAEARKQGAVLIVVPFSNVGSNLEMEGFVQEEEGNWTPCTAILPDAVYNRVPTRREEKTKTFLETRQAALRNGIPFLNEQFLTKLEINTILAQDAAVSEALPRTEILVSFEQFLNWLHDSRAFLIKLSSGSRGKGIYLIEKEEEGIRFTSRKGVLFPLTPDQCWTLLEPALAKRTFLLQTFVPLRKNNGLPFDFRILLHRLPSGWTCSGLGIRQAGKGRITTHALYGGSILSPGEAGIDPDKVKQLALRAASLLPDSFAEVSMDIGCDQEGKLWLFDVNSKPMIFDEEPIRLTGAANLIQLFREKWLGQK